MAPVVTALHNDQRRHLRGDLRLTLKAIAPVTLLVLDLCQAVRAYRRQAYPLNSPPAGGERVLTLVPLPRQPAMVGPQEFVIDRPALGFRG
jgi:hypothetical protein